MSHRSTFGLTTLFLFFAAAGVHAAPPAAPPANEPTTLTMTVRPAAPPTPALKYRLIPPVVDTVPGDAGPLYLYAAGACPSDDNYFGNRSPTPEQARDWGVKEDETWLRTLKNAPLEKLRGAPEVQQVLDPLQGSLQLLELATVQDRCDWGLPLREQGFATLLPHMNTLRTLAMGVCVKARAELARGDVAAAIATLRINFALARNLDDQAVLIQQLIGAAILSLSLEVLAEVQSLPDAPNLYWALADLPTPMFDLRQSLETERAAVYWSLPELQKVRKGTFTEQDWQVMSMRLVPLLGMRDHQRFPLEDRWAVLAMAIVVYPTARQALIEQGVPAADVDAMPKAAVVARYYVDGFETIYDDLVKWSALPYWQARASAEDQKQTMQKLRATQPANLLLQVVPAVQRAAHTLHRVDRQIAAQQTVEALRAHAAANKGKLPAALEDLTDLPAPIDPMTGKPFVYKAEGNKVTLESLAPETPRDGLVVKVTLLPPEK